MVAAPGNPGIGARPSACPSTILDGSAVAALAREWAPTSSSWAPRHRSWPGWPTCAAPRDRLFGPSAEAAASRAARRSPRRSWPPRTCPRPWRTSAPPLDEVEAALDAFGAPHVVKDDGLAAGKGVVVTDRRAAALGHAGAACERPAGRSWSRSSSTARRSRCSASATATGVVPLAPAQDFKRVGDGDAGPNTGGMGAYSPLAWAPEGLADEVVERVAQPTIDEMRRRGTPFVGVLYCGLALTSRGLRVIEFNARFGDPETQVVLARLASPLGRAAARRRDRSARRLGAAALARTGRRSPWSSPRTGYPDRAAHRRRDHRPRRRGAGAGVTSCTPARPTTAGGWSPPAGACSTVVGVGGRPDEGAPRPRTTAWTSIELAARTTAPTSRSRRPRGRVAAGLHPSSPTLENPL